MCWSFKSTYRTGGVVGEEERGAGVCDRGIAGARIGLIANRDGGACKLPEADGGVYRGVVGFLGREGGSVDVAECIEALFLLVVTQSASPYSAMRAPVESACGRRLHLRFIMTLGTRINRGMRQLGVRTRSVLSLSLGLVEPKWQVKSSLSSGMSAWAIIFSTGVATLVGVTLLALPKPSPRMPSLTFCWNW